MRPAWSIIFFTVLSGWGLGLAAVLVAVEPHLPVAEALPLAVVAGVLVAAGLGSSVGHLANPKNAWRALFRLRSSWLSREALLVLLFFASFAAWLATRWPWLAVLTGALALLTVLATAMIYAVLKPIRLWRHPLTPAVYLLLALQSGLMTMAAVAGERLPLLLFLSLGVTVAAGLAKIWHFRRAAVVGRLGVRQATGIGTTRPRLLDMGHSADNFLTREFVYQADEGRIWRMRRLTGGLAFVFPAFVVLAVAAFSRGYGVLWLAVFSLFLGLLAERWLFFAEARHVVRLYHGDSAA